MSGFLNRPENRPIPARLPASPARGVGRLVVSAFAVQVSGPAVLAVECLADGFAFAVLRINPSLDMRSKGFFRCHDAASKSDHLFVLSSRMAQDAFSGPP